MNYDLSGLKGFHFPQMPPSFPFAYGWWVLGAVIILSLYALIRHIRKQYQVKMTLKRSVNKEITRLTELYNHNQNVLASEIALLLRRLVLMKFPRKKVAILHGEKWRFFLEKSIKTPFFSRNFINPFNGDAGDIVEKVLYVPEEQFKVKDASLIINALKKWVDLYA